MRWRIWTLGLLLMSAASLRADEIRLKDGSKIVGTIVDFENESFKIQTAYGFAMVRKDSISQIIPTAPDASGESARVAAPATPLIVKPAAVSEPFSPTVKAEAQPAVSRTAAPSGSSAAPKPASMSLAMPAPNPKPVRPVALAAAAPVPNAAAPVSLPAVAASMPAPAPLKPGPIRESVEGNLYTNASYSFQLYRPPGWDVIPEARKAMPNAITAMGTPDETTLFVVGREPAHDSLDAQAGNAERALQKVYENYRHVSSAKKMVGGLPAVEWKFRGIADGHDWSVTALSIAREADVFTLLGMTYADSDLIQLRENVIAKMMSSLRFSTPQ